MLLYSSHDGSIVLLATSESERLWMHYEQVPSEISAEDPDGWIKRAEQSGFSVQWDNT